MRGGRFIVVGSNTPAAQLDEQILLADAEARRLGLTMVHDAGASVREVAAYKRLIDQGRLKTRLYVMLAGSLDTLKAEFGAAHYHRRRDRVRTSQIRRHESELAPR